MYHQYNDLIRGGDYYRISSYHENREYDCWEVVSKDKTQVLISYVQVLGRANYHSRILKLQGLDPDAVYRDSQTQQCFGGDTLMYAGFPVKNLWGDYQSALFFLTKE